MTISSKANGVLKGKNQGESGARGLKAGGKKRGGQGRGDQRRSGWSVVLKNRPGGESVQKVMA